MTCDMEARMANESITEEWINNLMDEDNILADWVLVNSYLVVFILLGYLLLLWTGIRVMRTRRPFKLTFIMRVYNLFQICFNIYLLFAFVRNPDEITSIIVYKSCSVDIIGDELSGLRYAYLYYTWGFMVSKITDLLDTIFMMLRKKNSHITFLHVYHHVAMVFFSWVTLKFAKAHQAALPGLINAFVHVIMYTYYFLSTFGPSLQKYLWWKKHLTKLQLAQFVVIIVYLFLLYINNCPISKVFTYIWLFNVFVFFCLFVNFYVKSYILKQTEEKTSSKRRKSS